MRLNYKRFAGLEVKIKMRKGGLIDLTENK